MQSFIPRLKTSCMALLGMIGETPSTSDDRFEKIRDLMLDEIGPLGAKQFPQVARRIRYAVDAQGLWYVRSEMMAILASIHGETIAAQKIAVISCQFKGLLPPSLTASAFSRPR